VLNEFLVPRATDEMEFVMTRYETNQVQQYTPEWELKFGFKNIRKKRTWYIEAFNRDNGGMVGPRVYYQDDENYRHDIWAAGASYEKGHWIFTNVQEFIYPPEPGALPTPFQADSRVMTELNETPEEINIQIKISRIEDFRNARKAQLSIRDILLYKRMHPEDRQKDTLLHGRLAAPFTCLVVVLIALPFGAASGRRNVFVGVAGSIVICFGFFVCQQLGLALGYGGRLPGWLAGWLPNLVFASLGLFLTWRAR
jgi:lipopolysaccharide export system permease protein